MQIFLCCSNATCIAQTQACVMWLIPYVVTSDLDTIKDSTTLPSDGRSKDDTGQETLYTRITQQEKSIFKDVSLCALRSVGFASYQVLPAQFEFGQQLACSAEYLRPTCSN